MATTDFRTDHLNGTPLRVAKLVLQFLTEFMGESPDGGGCQAFYSPQEWVARGEEYGTGPNSALILCHDGGNLAPFCNWDYCEYGRIEALQDFLRSNGLHMEQCTSWYSAVYAD